MKNKKFLALFLSTTLMFSAFTGCGKQENVEDETVEEDTIQVITIETDWINLYESEFKYDMSALPVYYTIKMEAPTSKSKTITDENIESNTLELENYQISMIKNGNKIYAKYAKDGEEIWQYAEKTDDYTPIFTVGTTIESVFSNASEARYVGKEEIDGIIYDKVNLITKTKDYEQYLVETSIDNSNLILFDKNDNEIEYTTNEDGVIYLPEDAEIGTVLYNDIELLEEDSEENEYFYNNYGSSIVIYRKNENYNKAIENISTVLVNRESQKIYKVETYNNAVFIISEPEVVSVPENVDEIGCEELETTFGNLFVVFAYAEYDSDAIKKINTYSLDKLVKTAATDANSILGLESESNDLIISNFSDGELELYDENGEIIAYAINDDGTINLSSEKYDLIDSVVYNGENVPGHGCIDDVFFISF